MESDKVIIIRADGTTGIVSDEKFYCRFCTRTLPVAQRFREADHCTSCAEEYF